MRGLQAEAGVATHAAVTAARNLCDLMLERNKILRSARQAGLVGNEPLISSKTYELATVTDKEYFDGTVSVML